MSVGSNVVQAASKTVTRDVDNDPTKIIEVRFKIFSWTSLEIIDFDNMHLESGIRRQRNRSRRYGHESSLRTYTIL